jgi:hypothetical protein
MAHPLVVNIKKDGCDIYVGRGSDWGNPFKFGSRRENIDEFHRWLRNNPPLMARLPELRGKVLGCHCAPKDCHADVLAELANG